MTTTNKAKTERLCEESVYRGDNRMGDYGLCGRPVAEGNAICNFHISVKRRAEEAHNKRTAEHEASEARQAKAQAVCDALWALCINAKPEYSGIRLAYTGGDYSVRPAGVVGYPE